MLHRFTEKETEHYYDSEDEVYRALWDENGSVHWGLFDETTGTNFLDACANLNTFMCSRAGLDASANVLDIGCGSGTTAISLSRELGCSVTGIDLSGVRVDNAIEALGKETGEVRNRMRFHKASATELPFEDGSFSHVWSQATFYHVPDKKAALQEAFRVLNKGGSFVFDDLTKPKSEISEDAQKYVYERLLYDTDFGFVSYQETLQEIGFRVVEAYDLSDHLRTSYECLADLAGRGNEEHQERFQYLREAYKETALAAERGEVGWAMFLCHR